MSDCGGIDFCKRDELENRAEVAERGHKAALAREGDLRVRVRELIEERDRAVKEARAAVPLNRRAERIRDLTEALREIREIIADDSGENYMDSGDKLEAIDRIIRDVAA